MCPFDDNDVDTIAKIYEKIQFILEDALKNPEKEGLNYLMILIEEDKIKKLKEKRVRLPEYFVATYKAKVAGIEIFEVPIDTMTKDELLAVLGYYKEHVVIDEEKEKTRLDSIIGL